MTTTIAISKSARRDRGVNGFCTFSTRFAFNHSARSQPRTGTDLRAAFHARLHTTRASGLLLKPVDSLFNSPAMTIPQAAALLGVTYRSAQQNVERLFKAEILREVTGRKRNRIFICDGIVAAVEGADASRRRE